MFNSADSITKRPDDAPLTLPVAAGIRRRLTAAAYDSLLLTAIFFVVTAIVVARHRAGVPSGAVWFQSLLAATAWLYFAWCWVHGGQTVGMRAWKIRVVDATEAMHTTSWGKATLRFVLAFVPALPLTGITLGLDVRLATAAAVALYAAGFGAAAFRRDRACWLDLLSRTRLIRADR